MKKKKDEEDDKGITKSFLEAIPLFGDFFKELGKTETFKQRFKEVDEKIKENLKKGQEKKWGFESRVSVRPLSMRPSMKQVFGEIKKDAPDAELEIKKDYAYGKKGNKLLLAVKVQMENVDLSIKGKTLFIKGDNFQKKIGLPDFYKSITKKHYKKGTLMLELSK